MSDNLPEPPMMPFELGEKLYKALAGCMAVPHLMRMLNGEVPRQSSDPQAFIDSIFDEAFVVIGEYMEYRKAREFNDERAVALINGAKGANDG